MLVGLHSVWVWDLSGTRQSWFENGNVSSNSTEFVFLSDLILSWIGAQSADKCPIHDWTCLKDLSLVNLTARPYYDPILTKPNQCRLQTYPSQNWVIFVVLRSVSFLFAGGTCQVNTLAFVTLQLLSIYIFVVHSWGTTMQGSFKIHCPHMTIPIKYSIGDICRIRHSNFITILRQGLGLTSLTDGCRNIFFNYTLTIKLHDRS